MGKEQLGKQLRSQTLDPRYSQERFSAPVDALSMTNFKDGSGKAYWELGKGYNFRVYSDTGYIDIDSEYGILLSGDTTIWDDLMPLAVSIGPGASGASFTAYNGNLYAYEFIGTTATVKNLQCAWQLSHGWKEGSTVYPHLHLYVPNNAGAAAVVKFFFEYTWVNRDGIEGAATVVSSTISVPSGAGAQHRSLDFDPIAGTGKTMSSILQGRIYRNPADGDDTYGTSVWLKSLDLHIEKDRLGSRTASAL